MELNLSKKNLPFAFLLCLSLFLGASLFLPAWKLFFFAPFLVILIYQKSKLGALCAGLLSGLTLDLFSTQATIPLNAINYCLTVLFLYDQRQHFFGDSLSTLPIMVYFFGALATLLQGILREIVYKQPFLSAEWVVSDVLLFPLADAAFAFAIFTFPALLFGKRPRRGSEYFSG